MQCKLIILGSNSAYLILASNMLIQKATFKSSLIVESQFDSEVFSASKFTSIFDGDFHIFLHNTLSHLTYYGLLLLTYERMPQTNILYPQSIMLPSTTTISWALKKNHTLHLTSTSEETQTVGSSEVTCLFENTVFQPRIISCG